MPRFMIIVKATKESEAGVMPPEEMFRDMGAYHEELAKAGLLLDASGLQPTAKGWRVKCQDGKRSVVDGPFAETKELIAGFTIIRANSRDEAIAWTQRFPNPNIGGADFEIEVRQLFELEDFAQSAALETFHELRDRGLGNGATPTSRA